MELGSGGGGGGESEANHAMPSSDDAAGKDHLSALPDDALILILLHLSTRDAVRTSILSRRWHRIWALLPGLAFNSNDTNPHQIVSTLEAHEAALRCLLIFSQDATTDSVAAWLPVAACRLSGRLYFKNFEQERITQEGYEEIYQEDDEDMSQEGDEETSQESDEDISQEGDEETSQEGDEEISHEDDEETSQEGDDEISQEGDEEEEVSPRGAFELPCMERATSIALHLGSLSLTVTPAGVFTRLRELWLSSVRLQRPSLLSDAIFWPRCPCLQWLTVRDACELDNLAIHSNSLQKVELTNVRSLHQLTVVAPALEELEVKFCFYYSRSQPIASITAPQLGTLMWSDLYDPGSVHLGKMEHLRLLMPFAFSVSGNDSVTLNRSCLSLLQRYKVVEHLILTLFYQQNMDNNQYMMEDMTMLPDITILDLNVIASGHCFGASAFHVLRMCSSIRRLMLTLAETEEQITCPPGCICIQQQNWETEHLLLNRLEEVEIDQFGGSAHEFTFVKQLFIWATALEKMTVTFDNSVSESVAKELGQVLQSFSRPEIAWKFACATI